MLGARIHYHPICRRLRLVKAIPILAYSIFCRRSNLRLKSSPSSKACPSSNEVKMSLDARTLQSERNSYACFSTNKDGSMGCIAARASRVPEWTPTCILYTREKSMAFSIVRIHEETFGSSLFNIAGKRCTYDYELTKSNAESVVWLWSYVYSKTRQVTWDSMEVFTECTLEGKKASNQIRTRARSRPILNRGKEYMFAQALPSPSNCSQTKVYFLLKSWRLR